MLLVETVELDELALIYLNRPERLNAIVTGLVQELCTALASAAERCAGVVICGRGRAFCSGQDLNESLNHSDVESHRRALSHLQDVTRLIRAFPGPVIAAVQGYALGAGCEIALAADFTIAARDANFGFPEVKKGLGVTGGISYLLPRMIGLPRAKELVLLGEWISAERAVELGMIHSVVEPDELEAAAIGLAERLIAQPREALLRARRTLDAGAQGTLEQAFEYEIVQALSATANYEGAE
jgi:2-(1,2-epoxy-1,2-dihydrophenyl)acetyl-CoA isomerase